MKLDFLKRKWFLALELCILGGLITLLVVKNLPEGWSNPKSSAIQNVTNFKPKTEIVKATTIKPKVSPSPSALSKIQANLLPQVSGTSLRVPILMYHYIGNNPNPSDTERSVLSTAPDVFDTQMNYLSQNGYNPISLDTLYAALQGGSLPSKPIVLTFDDGYIDFYVNAFPILSKYHFHAISFIPTGLIGEGYYMSWDQIKQIQSSGLISFEAHSISHPNLVALSPGEAQNQITQSKQVLENETGAKVNFFAYPYGTSNSLIWQDVKNAGYFGGLGTWSGKIESTGDQYDWPRVRINGGISMQQFEEDVE